MIKNFILLFILIFVSSCSTNNAVVRTSKPDPRKSGTPEAQATRKPIYKPTGQKQSDTEPQKPKISVSNQDNSAVVLEATTRVKVTTQMVLAYIEQYKEIAKDNMVKTGIPSSITLGQAILESGAGTGPLSIQANNHFGIKCHTGWTGESVRHDDDAEQECFRKYQHPSESYRDHSLFLTSRPRYSNLFKLDKGDYESWAKGLKAAGYATDVKYPDKLIGLIERFELYSFDNEVLNREFTPIKKDIVAIKNSDFYTIQKGDTLFSLSRKFNLTVEDLMKLNNMSDVAIAIGQQIKIK